MVNNLLKTFYQTSDRQFWNPIW